MLREREREGGRERERERTLLVCTNWSAVIFFYYYSVLLLSTILPTNNDSACSLLHVLYYYSVLLLSTILPTNNDSARGRGCSNVLDYTPTNNAKEETYLQDKRDLFIRQKRPEVRIEGRVHVANRSLLSIEQVSFVL